MHRGTTPTYTFTLPESINLTDATDVYVTFSKPDETVILTKTGNDVSITEHTAEVYLTQEETLSFPIGQIVIQLNWIYTEGSLRKRACSKKLRIKSEKNLLEEVL